MSKPLDIPRTIPAGARQLTALEMNDLHFQTRTRHTKIKA